jgi:hypothetical protein
VAGPLVILSLSCKDYECPLSCPENQGAGLVLSCIPASLRNVSVSGPCAMADSGPSLIPDPKYPRIWIPSAGPGKCHVTLNFDNGAAVSADVAFVSQQEPPSPGCYACPPYLVGIPTYTNVATPGQPCLDAGVTDAGVIDADAHD